MARVIPAIEVTALMMCIAALVGCSPSLPSADRIFPVGVTRINGTVSAILPQGCRNVVIKSLLISRPGGGTLYGVDLVSGVGSKNLPIGRPPRGYVAAIGKADLTQAGSVVAGVVVERPASTRESFGVVAYRSADVGSDVITAGGRRVSRRTFDRLSCSL
jgi:hypothetical protein